MVRRHKMAVFNGGIPGYNPRLSLDQVMNGMFECDGNDYFVCPSLQGSSWLITKVAHDGRPLAYYNVKRAKEGMQCDCQAGSKHLVCRHKEMALEFSRPAAPVQPKHTSDVRPQAGASDVQRCLDNARKLLELYNARR